MALKRIKTPLKPDDMFKLIRFFNSRQEELFLSYRNLLLELQADLTLSLSLDDLTDVNAPTPANGNVLAWNAATNSWIASAAAAGTGTVQQVNTGTGLTGGPFTVTGTVSLNSKLAPADSLTGNALKVLRVNAGETAVEYAPAGTGTVTSVNSGININVDNTNPAAPIINSLSDRYKTTSTTSNSVSNGSKSFTVDLNLSYIPLQEILVVHNPANHMHGEVTSYNAATGALVVDIKTHTGSGTYTSWVINLDGTPVDALTGSGTANEIAYFTAARVLASLPVATYPNLTELSYIKGLASAAQTQINGKQDALTTTKSVKIVSSNVELDGDLASPGNNKVYGTDGSGAKVWKADPTGGGNSIGQLTSPGDVTTAAATTPSQGLAATLDPNYKKGSAGVVFDGAGGVITTNTIAYVQVPYNGTITGWTLVSSISGSCTVTAFKDTYANFPPTTTTDDIFVTPPAISATNKAQNLSAPTIGLFGTVTAGDWIGFRITGITTVTWVNLTLSITKTL